MTRDELLALQSGIPQQPESLLDMKIDRVQKRLQAKQVQQRDPTDSLGALRRLKTGDYQGESNTGLVDVAQSSLLNEFGYIADGTRDLFNSATGKDWQLSKSIDTLSDRNVTDRITGVSPEFRQEEALRYQSMTDDIDNEEYLSAFGKGLGLSTNFLANSAGTLGSGLAGGLATGGFKVGASLLTRGAKTAQKSNKLMSGIKNVANVTSQSSLMTLADVQRKKEAFFEENGYEMPSDVLGLNFVTSSILNTAQFKIGTKLIKPSIKKETAEVVKDLVKIKPESFRKDIAQKLYVGTKKVLTASGAEAAQEYLQTWSEILSPKVTDTKFDTIMDQIAEQTGIKENKTEAIFGAMAGGASGGTLKAAITAPTTALGVTSDVTKGLIKKGVNAGVDYTNKKSYALLSKDKRQEIKDKHEAEKELYKETETEVKARVTELVNAKTFSDLKDSKVLSDMESLQDERDTLDEELSDPKVFKGFKDNIIAKYRSDLAIAKKDIYQGSTARLLKGIKEDTGNSVDTLIKKVNMKDALDTAKSISKDAYESLFNMKSTAAAGIVQKASTYTGDTASKVGKEIKVLAKELDEKDLKSTIDLLGETHPKTAELLKSALDIQQNASIELGIKKKELIDYTNLPNSVKDASKGVNTSLNAGLIRDLIGESSKKIADEKTLSAMVSAVKNFKQSKTYIKGSKSYKQNIDRLENKINKLTPYKTTAEVVKETSNKVYKKTKNYLSDKAEEFFKEDGGFDNLLDGASTLVFKAKIDPKKEPELAAVVKYLKENPDVEEISNVIASLSELKDIDSINKVKKFLKSNKILESDKSINKVARNLKDKVKLTSKKNEEYDNRKSDTTVKTSSEDMLEDVNDEFKTFNKNSTKDDKDTNTPEFQEALKIVGSNKFFKVLTEELAVESPHNLVQALKEYVPALLDPKHTGIVDALSNKLLKEYGEDKVEKAFAEKLKEEIDNDIERRDTDKALAKKEARKAMEELNIKECK